MSLQTEVLVRKTPGSVLSLANDPVTHVEHVVPTHPQQYPRSRSDAALKKPSQRKSNSGTAGNSSSVRGGADSASAEEGRIVDDYA